MNSLLRALPLAAVLLLSAGCGAFGKHRPPPPETVLPRFTIFPAQETMPAEIVADLPRRLAALPKRNYTVRSLVRALGLRAYEANVSQNFRWSTYFLYLDKDNVLHMTFSDYPAARQAALDGHNRSDAMFQTDWGARVSDVSLHRDTDETVASRDFPAK